AAFAPRRRGRGTTSRRVSVGGDARASDPGRGGIRLRPACAAGSRRQSSDRLGDAVDSIVRQSRRLAALITQLLDASYGQRGQFEIEPRPTDISAVAGWALEAARLAVDGRHQWDLRIEPGMSAHVDPMRWEQLLMNLLDNAMKYSPERPTRAEALGRLPPGPFPLRIADQGIGIGPDRIGHVFDRFYRAHD